MSPERHRDLAAPVRVITLIELPRSSCPGTTGVLGCGLAQATAGPHGRVELLEGPPASAMAIDTAVDEAFYVVAGTVGCTHVSRSREVSTSLGAGDVLYVPAGGSVRLETRGRACTRVIRATSTQGGAGGSPVRVASVAAPDAATMGLAWLDHPELKESVSLLSYWIPSGAPAESYRCVHGAAPVAERQGDLHRHADADEFHLLLVGSGRYETDHAVVDVRAGQLVVIPAGEPHEFNARRGLLAVGVFGFLGAPALCRTPR